MTISFPTNRVGTYYGDVRKIETKSAYWGSGAHDVSESWEVICPTYYSYKHRAVKGDHAHSTDYYRDVVICTDDSPFITIDSGSDINGSYFDARTSFMSKWLVPISTLNETGTWYGLRTNDSDRCITEALNKLREGKVQNGSDIGEARKTAEQIAVPFTTLMQAYKAAKVGNWKKVPDILGMNRRDILSGKFAANKWLEYQYGWKPLMGSIHDNVQLLDKALRKPKNTFSVQRSRKLKFSETINSPVNPSGVDSQDVWENEQRCRVYMSCRISNQFITGLDTAGVLNPLSIAWELTPFSFVLDWFIPVGNVLSALSATLGLELEDGYISVSNERAKTSKILRSKPTPGAVLVNPGKCRFVGYTFQRYALRNFPMPRLYANINPFSTTHVTSALALLHQLMVGR